MFKDRALGESGNSFFFLMRLLPAICRKLRRYVTWVFRIITNCKKWRETLLTKFHLRTRKFATTATKKEKKLSIARNSKILLRDTSVFTTTVSKPHRMGCIHSHYHFAYKSVPKKLHVNILYARVWWYVMDLKTFVYK